LGWRWVFDINVPIGLFVALLSQVSDFLSIYNYLNVINFRQEQL
jgi:hypothetical protein